MPYDQNPERRNLTVTSLAIILFYIGGGKLAQEGVIKMPLVNVVFENTCCLTIALWVALIFFFWRYWLTNKDKLNNSLMAEMTQHNLWPIKLYAQLKLKQKHLHPDTFVITKFHRRGAGRWIIMYKFVFGGELLESGQLIKHKLDRDDKQLRMTGPIALPFKLFLLVRIGFIKQGISNYLFPYLFFFVAILLGLINNLDKILQIILP